MIFTRVSSLLVLAGVATAHFILNFPPNRGVNETTGTIAPCGGFNVSGTPTPFPLGDGFIRITSTHHANISARISFVDNPTDIRNFTFTPSGTPQAPLQDFFSTEVKDICINVNFAGYPNVTEGTRATISIQSQGTNSSSYQCGDIVLFSNATIPSNYTCTTATGSDGAVAPSASTTTRPNGAERATIGLGFVAVVMALLGAVLHV